MDVAVQKYAAVDPSKVIAQREVRMARDDPHVYYSAVCYAFYRAHLRLPGNERALAEEAQRNMCVTLFHDDVLNRDGSTAAAGGAVRGATVVPVAPVAPLLTPAAAAVARGASEKCTVVCTLPAPRKQGAGDARQPALTLSTAGVTIVDHLQQPPGYRTVEWHGESAGMELVEREQLVCALLTHTHTHTHTHTSDLPDMLFAKAALEAMFLGVVQARRIKPGNLLPSLRAFFRTHAFSVRGAATLFSPGGASSTDNDQHLECGDPHYRPVGRFSYCVVVVVVLVVFVVVVLLFGCQFVLCACIGVASTMVSLFCCNCGTCFL